MKSLFGVLLVCCVVAPYAATSNTDTLPAIGAPTASHKSGTYSSNGSLTVHLQSDTPRAEIFYSVNGGRFKQYNDRIVITENTEIMAYSKLGTRTSEQIRYSYNLCPNVVINTDNLAAITISTPVGETAVTYTIDGGNECVYSYPIAVEEGATIKIKVTRDNWSTAIREIVIEENDDSPHAPIAVTPVKTRYYYNLLTDEQKQCYLALEQGIASYAEVIDLSSFNLSNDDFETAYWAFDYENPQYFWLGNSLSYDHIHGSVVKVYPQYSRSWNKTREIQAEFDKVTAEVISRAASMQKPFDQLLYIHDWIVNNTEYVSNGSAYISEADGPIAYGYALCEGYAKAFAYLSNQLGYNCICVVGSTKEEHMWNMIEIDGEWYHVDVTSDDPISKIDVSLHDYFCVPTSYIKLDHAIKNILPIPDASATTYNYHEYLGIPTHISVIMAYNDLLEQAAEGKSHLEVHCSKGVLPDLVTRIKNKFYKDLSARGVYPRTFAYQRYTHSLILELTF